jgi:hypothetical protein
VFLAEVASRVHMLVRGPNLSDSMSRYLIKRIEGTPNIELRTRTQIDALEGERGLERAMSSSPGSPMRLAGRTPSRSERNHLPPVVPGSLSG